jgi:hypothetical protein
MKFPKTLLAGVVTLGLLSPAAFAKDFIVDHNMYTKHQDQMQQRASYNSQSWHDFQKYRFSGDSAYTGGLAGQVAYQTDPIGDMDGKAFTVHPVRGRYGEFNSSLRYGDTGQSRATRFNQTFNN